MNKQERKLAGRLYDCLRVMSTLQPKNPADIAAVSHNLRISTKAARELRAALEHLMYAEYDVAAEYLDDAERILQAPVPESSADRRKRLAAEAADT